MNDIFFWSDTHFWHTNILKHQPNRKYSSIEEMNEVLIAIWNETVKNNDTVYFLGDFAMGRFAQAAEIFARLNGNIHLVRGNHDDKKICSLGWESVNDIVNLKACG